MAMKQVALNSIESDDDNIKAWYSTHGQWSWVLLLLLHQWFFSMPVNAASVYGVVLGGTTDFVPRYLPWKNTTGTR